MGDAQRKSVKSWIVEPLSFRWARALACGHTGAEGEWQTLFPDLPDETWKRYFRKVHVTICERRDYDMKGQCLTQAKWLSEYEAFAKAVLNSEKAPSMKMPEPSGLIKFFKIDYDRLLNDIAESANMMPDVVTLGRFVWKIGHVRVAKRMDTHPAFRFVGRLDADSQQTLAECAGGKYPGGVLVPSKEELSESDFKWLKKCGLAVFGFSEDCHLDNRGVFQVRDPRAWVSALEPQIHPGELLQARLPPGVLKRRGPDADLTVGAKLDVAIIQRPNEPDEGGKFRIKRHGEAVVYDGKTYEFSAPKQWGFLDRLYVAKGAYVDCGKGLKRFFSRPKDAMAFYEAAIQPKGVGRKGDGTYRLNI